MEFRTEEDVKRELGRRLGHAPKERHWRVLVKRDRVEGVLNGGGDEIQSEEMDALVEVYGEYEDVEREAAAGNARSSVPSRDVPRSSHPTDALDALSEIVAHEAQSHPLVVAFRERVLGGSCLSPGANVAWNLAHEGQVWPGGLPRSYPTGGAREMPAGGTRETFWQIRTDADRYAAGDLPVDGREADFMACVVDVLGVAYGWPHPYEVEEFVLSGETPSLPPAIAYMASPIGPFHPRTARVHLNVSPQMDPKALMRLYAEMRQTFMKPNSRIRPPGEAPSRLAVFVARHNDGSTWQEVWSAWNAEGGRQYAEERSFTRDARKAYLMVTGEDLEWSGGASANRKGQSS